MTVELVNGYRQDDPTRLRLQAMQLEQLERIQEECRRLREATGVDELQVRCLPSCRAAS